MLDLYEKNYINDVKYCNEGGMAKKRVAPLSGDIHDRIKDINSIIIPDMLDKLKKIKTEVTYAAINKNGYIKVNEYGIFIDFEGLYNLTDYDKNHKLLKVYVKTPNPDLIISKMKKVNEGIDRYDDMDVQIDMANKEMENLLKLLKKEKIQVKSFKVADYDINAYINLKNGVTIQITLDGTYEVSTFDGRVIKHIKSFPNVNRLIQFLKLNEQELKDYNSGNKDVINKHLLQEKKESDIDKIKMFLQKGIKMYKYGSSQGKDDIASFKEWADAYENVLKFINKNFNSKNI